MSNLAKKNHIKTGSLNKQTLHGQNSTVSHTGYDDRKSG